MAVFISRRHACDQAKLVHHSRGRNLEESTEFGQASPDEVTGEIADVYEVLRALAAVHGHDWATIEEVAAAKREERGAFRERLYLA
ncbi:nucleoside triphosphate pyrophosphohydrolase [Nonomuraea sp. ATR24]|uniref:nucleoside triphosphate pyrophosphohydrolase n=1 Tax=Nonomuraea sp. ATR24 TaxID=1676744 RepID=UPI0035C13B8B